MGTARPVGLGLAPIPFTAIVEYFRIYELSDFDEFSYVIRRMDNAFIELNTANSATGDNNGGRNTDKKNPNKG